MPSEHSRKVVAQFLSRDLSSFGTCFGGQFLCPTCMEPFDVEKDLGLYTAGHIVPEAAGGTEWTLLCRICNSRFGSRQDKWFGEYLNVLQNSEGSFIHAKTKSKYITVNGVTVSGTIGISSEDGAIEIFTPIKRTPPGKVESITHGEKLDVQFTPEIVKHVNEVQVGYITAAYLKWFKSLGYSWAMQSSLSSVRKQIQNCDYTIRGAKVIELKTDHIYEPDIAAVADSGHIYPCCLMHDRVVVFPAPGKAPNPREIRFGDKKKIYPLSLAPMDVPYAVSFEGGMLIFPDMLRQESSVPEHLLYVFSDHKKEPRWLVLEK